MKTILICYIPCYFCPDPMKRHNDLKKTAIEAGEIFNELVIVEGSAYDIETKKHNDLCLKGYLEITDDEFRIYCIDEDFKSNEFYKIRERVHERIDEMILEYEKEILEKRKKEDDRIWALSCFFNISYHLAKKMLEEGKFSNKQIEIAVNDYEKRVYFNSF